MYPFSRLEIGFCERRIDMIVLVVVKTATGVAMKTQRTVAYVAASLLVAGMVLAACNGGGGSAGGAGSGIAPNALSGGAIAEQAAQRDTAQAMPNIAPFRFLLTVSAGAKACLPHAQAVATLSEANQNVEQLQIAATGLPKDTDFDVFIIQAPNKPFGLSWYQGDLNTGSTGTGTVTFLGRFSIETFIVAPGSTAAPIVFHNTFPDVGSNPTTGPVHEYHVGVWFNLPSDAVKAGCAGTVTPFNGTHNAGIQVLNTATFPLLDGPLRHFNP